MVNIVGKNISEAERAYLAGLIDADGAIMAVIEPHKETRFRFRVRVIVKLTQHQPDVLNWSRLTFNCGKVVTNRTTHDWLIRSREDARMVIESIRLFLKVKQRQADMALAILAAIPKDKEEFLKVVRLADTLSKLNVRSTNRRINNAAMVEAVFSRND